MSIGNTVFITAGLPYINNVPHCGGIMSLLSADAYSRYRRKLGHKVFYLCGTDEYGTTTEVKAQQEGLSCQEICDKYHRIHKEIYDWFNIQFDAFGRTSTDTHTKLSQEVFLELFKNGCLEEQDVEQYKCINCDRFLADRYIKGFCYVCKAITTGDQCDKCGTLIDVEKLTDCWCSSCNNQPKKVDTKHMFLKLDNMKDELLKTIGNPSRTKLNKVASSITESWFAKEFENRCITRTLKWGVPVPEFQGLEQYRDKVLYVWFEAPIGYLSILAHHTLEWKDLLKGEWIQFMGKDNVPFHTILFPATVLGSKMDLPIVTHLSSTEYLNYQPIDSDKPEKFSKSNGIGIFGDHVIEISRDLDINEDYFRYYLLKIRPETGDSVFNWSEFATIIKGELAQKMGNFINRCISMTKRYYPEKTEIRYSLTENLTTELRETIKTYQKAMDNINYHLAMRSLNRVAELGNEFINLHKLWIICKDNAETNENLFGCILYIGWCLSEVMEPFMPKKAQLIKKSLSKDDNLFISGIQDEGYINFDNSECEILFKQIDMKAIDASLERLKIR